VANWHTKRRFAQLTREKRGKNKSRRMPLPSKSRSATQRKSGKEGCRFGEVGRIGCRCDREIRTENFHFWGGEASTNPSKSWGRKANEEGVV